MYKLQFATLLLLWLTNEVSSQACIDSFGTEETNTFISGYACQGATIKYDDLATAKAACCDCGDGCAGLTLESDGRYTIRAGHAVPDVSSESSWKKPLTLACSLQSPDVGTYLAGYACGKTEYFSLEEAQKKCCECGIPCKGVTCGGGICTTRGGAMASSPSSETSYRVDKMSLKAKTERWLKVVYAGDDNLPDSCQPALDEALGVMHPTYKHSTNGVQYPDGLWVNFLTCFVYNTMEFINAHIFHSLEDGDEVTLVLSSEISPKRIDPSTGEACDPVFEYKPMNFSWVLWTKWSADGSQIIEMETYEDMTGEDHRIFGLSTNEMPRWEACGGDCAMYNPMAGCTPDNGLPGCTDKCANVFVP